MADSSKVRLRYKWHRMVADMLTVSRPAVLETRVLLPGMVVAAVLVSTSEASLTCSSPAAEAAATTTVLGTALADPRVYLVSLRPSSRAAGEAAPDTTVINGEGSLRTVAIPGEVSPRTADGTPNHHSVGSPGEASL